MHTHAYTCIHMHTHTFIHMYAGQMREHTHAFKCIHTHSTPGYVSHLCMRLVDRMRRVKNVCECVLSRMQTGMNVNAPQKMTANVC